MTNRKEYLGILDSAVEAPSLNPAAYPASKQGHSPLGASAAERWMACPGSVELIKALQVPSEPDDGPDYQKEGTAAHAVAAKCLTEHADAWEFVGNTVEGVEITQKIADAAQMYLDECRPLMAGADKVYVEHFGSSPLHPLMFGQTDFGAVNLTESVLDIRDLKNGMLPVDERGPQTKYYAFLLLQLHEEIRRVRIGIVQPNAFHSRGPIRVWECSAESIHEWVHDTLVPAMLAVEIDHSLDAGDHCRFCPAKLICPSVRGLFKAAALYDIKALPAYTDEQLGLDWLKIGPAKFAIKAIEAEVLKRLMAGRTLGGNAQRPILVAKKANRVFKAGAEAEFKKQYGADAYTIPELKSPAQMAEIGPVAADLVKQWAFTPTGGMTVAGADEGKPEMKVQTTQEIFGHVKTKELE